MGASKTYSNAKRFRYWSGMFHWICALTADCLTCRNNKPKPKHRNEVPLEEWQKGTVSFRFDHKGFLHPPSNQNLHCQLVVDAFSRFLMVYRVTNTGAQAVISAVEKWIHSFGISLSIVHDRGTAFINTEFINWTKELRITLRPPTAHSPWTNGKIETQNQHIARYWRKSLNEAGNNWSPLAPKFAFAQNISVKYTTGTTPYEIVFGTKPQIPMSLKLGLYCNKHKNLLLWFLQRAPISLRQWGESKESTIRQSSSTTNFTRTPGTRTRFQKNLSCHFRKMLRTNSQITFL